MKRHRQRTLRAPYPEPKQWVRNDEGGWTEALNEEAYKDAYTLWEWNVRNMRYADWIDRNDPLTDIGYVHKIHADFGLDVILHIAEIAFRPENFGSAEEHAANAWPQAHDIFT